MKLGIPVGTKLNTFMSLQIFYIQILYNNIIKN
jgi:hypothetical protein